MNQTLLTSDFTYYPKRKLFVANIKDFNNIVMGMTITLKSTKTGDTKVFEFDKKIGILHWEYRSLNIENDYHMIIYND